MSDPDTDDRETIYAVYLAARERPEPPEYPVLRDLLPDAPETTIDAAADAATLGAIHGATNRRALSRDELDGRLAAKDRSTLATETTETDAEDEGDGE